MIPEKSKNIVSTLITGDSGMIGRHLTSLLLIKGYEVSPLSRKATPVKGVNVFKWDRENKIIDRRAPEKCDSIIHLTGSNIGEKRWTKNRKREIANSRVDSADLLYSTFSGLGIKPFAFFCFSYWIFWLNIL
jgi:uncharacterized protein